MFAFICVFAFVCVFKSHPARLGVGFYHFTSLSILPELALKTIFGNQGKCIFYVCKYIPYENDFVSTFSQDARTIQNLFSYWDHRDPNPNVSLQYLNVLILTLINLQQAGSRCIMQQTWTRLYLEVPLPHFVNCLLLGSSKALI